ncbi:MAG: O-antigen ligase family protein [Chitinispirillales bacterium]|jgi:O-antigen ligase|nr:O-antigen ligase family protein [Chitinispirillales bacterium]
MAESVQTISGRLHVKRGNRRNLYAAIAIPALLSALVLILISKMGVIVAAGGVLLFFTGSIILLKGDVLSRSIYIFFLIQFAMSLFIPLSLFVTIISLLLFPLAFKRDAPLNGLTTPPYIKPLLLLFSGWLISLIYLSITNYGVFKYFFIYDIFFFLGLISAYEMFIAFRLKILTPDKLIPYIALSGLVMLCVVIGKYFVEGVALSMIFKERLGTSIEINPNFITSYLDMALPCAFFTAFFEKRSLAKKTFFYMASFAFVCAVLLSATRGSLPGIGILVAYAIWRKRSKRLLLGVALCAAVATVTVGAPMVKRIANPTTLEIMSNMGRVELLRSAFKVLKDNHYFFGIGMNNFSQIKFSYGFPQWLDTKRLMSSHNFFVEIWLGCGLLGLLGWLYVNAAIVLSILRKYKDNYAANAVAFAIIAFAAHGLFDSVCANFSMMLTYFSLMGIAFFLIKEGHTKSPSSDADPVTS